MAAALSVNVDHVATIREARKGKEPDPVTAAELAEIAGCDGIIVHQREDRRHIQERDVELLKRTVKTKLNLEMAATSEMVSIAKKIRPGLVTIVPEKRKELTTEGGIDVRKHFKTLRQSIRTLRDTGIRVSLFINPSDADIDAAKEAGADMVEIHTGMYAKADSDKTGTTDSGDWTLSFSVKYGLCGVAVAYKQEASGSFQPAWATGATQCS